MNYTTHATGGFTFGVVLTAGLMNTNVYEYAPLALIGIPIVSTIFSSFPDLDKKNTHASNRHPILNFFVHFAGHRGATHSIFIPIGLFLLAFASRTLIPNLTIQAYVFTFFLAASVGYLSHLFLDIITVMGIPLFYPFNKKKYSIAKLKDDRSGWWIKILLALVAIPCIVFIFGRLSGIGISGIDRMIDLFG